MKTKDPIDEATSTERLLDVIRGKADTAARPASQKSRVILPKPTKKSLPKSVTVGIDIGHNDVKMVKATRINNKWELLDSGEIPIPADIERGSDEFNNFLKSSVAPFCHGATKNVWAIISSALVDMRLIRIPRVSAKLFETTVHWTLKKELSIDEKDYVFDYWVMGEVTDSGGNKKTDVMCYSAPIEELEGVKKLFSAIGVPLKGMSPVSIAIQNIFMNYPVALLEKQAACLFIGNNFSRIDLYSDNKLTLNRNVKTGMNSIIEMLMEDLKSQTGDKIGDAEARKILFAYVSDSDGGPVVVDTLTAAREEIENIITPVLERLVRQVERTIDHFTTTLGYKRIEKIYISSVMPLHKSMIDYVFSQLGIECVLFDPLEQTFPRLSIDERISFIPAFGMALSDNTYTPNFAFPYKEKKRVAYVAKFNRVLLVCLIVSVFVCSSIGAYEWQRTAGEKMELARLQKQLQMSPAQVSMETVSGMLSAAGQKKQEFTELSRRYRGMALISELSSLTPAAVSLTSLKADLAEKDKGGNTAVLDGFIKGEQNVLDTMLSSYVMTLRASPLFSEVSISTSKVEPSRLGTFLTFTLNLKMGPGK